MGRRAATGRAGADFILLRLYARSLAPPPPPRHLHRVDKVTAALAQVDKRAADYRKSLPPKPIAEGLLVYVKKQAWER